jgi:hypothetical protein
MLGCLVRVKTNILSRFGFCVLVPVLVVFVYILWGSFSFAYHVRTLISILSLSGSWFLNVLSCFVAQLFELLDYIYSFVVVVVAVVVGGFKRVGGFIV